MTDMAIQAVLTGDIVNSTRLAPALEKKLLKTLHQVLASHTFEFYRGDSFQVYIHDAGLALQTALLCRTAAIALAQKRTVAAPDIRISIGIAKTKTPVTTLGRAKGDAFILSGRAFDKLSKGGTRLVIATANELAGEGLQVVADYVNAVFNNMTPKQAMVIFELLQGRTQQNVADKLKKSKSTISQHVSAGRWPEIEKLVKQYKNIINQLI